MFCVVVGKCRVEKRYRPFIGACDKRLNFGNFYGLSEAASADIRTAGGLSLWHAGLPVAHNLCITCLIYITISTH
jgi:hypothetical protein